MGHMIHQKGLKMNEKGQEIKKTCFLAELGGTPPLPPLMENHPAQKPLADKIR